MEEAFKGFLGFLDGIHDSRRAEGKRFALNYLLLFVILAIVAGANSYRDIHTFLKVHRRKLNAAFGLKWQRAPAYTALRRILIALDAANVEDVFRRHAANLSADKLQATEGRVLALDGKVLKGSFDALNDVRAKQILSVFASGSNLVLAHIEIDEKSNEIPAAQQLLKELGLADCIVTLDALHCQKKHSQPQRRRARISSSS